MQEIGSTSSRASTSVRNFHLRHDVMPPTESHTGGRTRRAVKYRGATEPWESAARLRTLPGMKHPLIVGFGLLCAFQPNGRHGCLTHVHKRRLSQYVADS